MNTTSTFEFYPGLQFSLAVTTTDKEFQVDALQLYIIIPSSSHQNPHGTIYDMDSILRIFSIFLNLDEDDNEAWILDGGAYGGQVAAESVSTDEPACG